MSYVTYDTRSRMSRQFSYNKFVSIKRLSLILRTQRYLFVQVSMDYYFVNINCKTFVPNKYCHDLTD